MGRAFEHITNGINGQTRNGETKFIIKPITCRLSISKKQILWSSLTINGYLGRKMDFVSLEVTVSFDTFDTGYPLSAKRYRVCGKSRTKYIIDTK
jgi:hypothetical protein